MISITPEHILTCLLPQYFDSIISTLRRDLESSTLLLNEFDHTDILKCLV